MFNFTCSHGLGKNLNCKRFHDVVKNHTIINDDKVFMSIANRAFSQ